MESKNQKSSMKKALILAIFTLLTICVNAQKNIEYGYKSKCQLIYNSVDKTHKFVQNTVRIGVHKDFVSIEYEGCNSEKFDIPEDCWGTEIVTKGVFVISCYDFNGIRFEFPIVLKNDIEYYGDLKMIQGNQTTEFQDIIICY